jgi:SAM-dependent methyltransferase
MLHLLNDGSDFSIPENAYLKAREKEGRFFSDAELLLLPAVSAHHPYAGEWKFRKKSLDILLQYFTKNAFSQAAELLEIGCGNGWVSNRLQQHGLKVKAIDINNIELEQAAKVFHEVDFYCGDILKAPDLGRFDYVLFMASLQYFEHPVSLFHFLKQNYLKDNGKIIVADTRFYSSSAIADAKQRSIRYYHQIGSPEMADFYFHHSFDVLTSFSFSALKKNTIFENLAGKLGWPVHPFGIYVIH